MFMGLTDYYGVTLQQLKTVMLCVISMETVKFLLGVIQEELILEDVICSNHVQHITLIQTGTLTCITHQLTISKNMFLIHHITLYGLVINRTKTLSKAIFLQFIGKHRQHIQLQTSVQESNVTSTQEL